MPGSNYQSRQAEMDELCHMLPSALALGILEHNNALTDSEKHAADKWMQQMEEAEAGSHIEQLEIDQQMKQLVERKALPQERDRRRKIAIEQYRKKVYAPIRRLPFEILSEIALYCVSEIPKIHIIFSHVCRIWRGAALSTPRMWTALQITLKDVQGLEQDIELIRMWFERAKGLPTIFFFVDFAPQFYHSEHLNNEGFSPWRSTPAGKLLGSLTDISPCFRHLKICCDIDDSRPVFQLPETWDLRRLECLEIGTMHALNSGGITFLTPDYHFPATPVLSHILMETSYPQIGGLLPWSQLKCIKIWPIDLTISEWVSIMLSCLSLETGIFSLLGVGSSHILLPPSYAGHNDLQNLSLGFAQSDDDNPIAILNAFHFPQLLNLDIIGYYGTIDGPFMELSRPLHSLRRISVGGYGGTCQHLPGLLKRTPQLVELSLRSCWTITPALTDILKYNVGTPDQNILTKLSKIHMEYKCVHTPGECYYNQELMKSALSSRTADALPNGCAKLDEINLLFSYSDTNQTKKTKAELSECLPDAMTLNIVDEPDKLPFFVVPKYNNVELNISEF